MKIRLLLSILLLISCSFTSVATHNLSGEITYKKVYPNSPSNYEYEITINTQLNASSLADRPYLYILYGDEEENAGLDSIARIEVYVESDIRYCTYKSFHNYSQPSQYLIQMEDPNRSGGVVNMEESISQSFFLESMLTISEEPAGTNQNSVVLLNSFIPGACLEETWAFNAACFDAEGDSLGYELVPCKGIGGLDINSWTLPDAILDVSYNGDFYTYNDGTIFWENPLVMGTYNIALKISEYRQGIEIGYVIKDFTVQVLPCSEPTLEFSAPVQDIEVYPWSQVFFTVSGHNVPSSSVISKSSGVISEINNPADFSVGYSDSQITGIFSWTPNSGDAREQPYLVVFNIWDSDTEIDPHPTSVEVVKITVLDPGENSINEKEDLDFKVFPNPVSSSFLLEMENPSNQEYILYSALGEQLMIGTVNSKTQIIDLSILPANVYFLMVENRVVRVVKAN